MRASRSTPEKGPVVLATPAAQTSRRATAGISEGSFARHESFHFRDGWLPKGLEAVAEDPLVFNNPEAMDVLGVGKNMVNSIRHWIQALSLVEEDPTVRAKASSRLVGYRASAFGKLVGKNDPYFESDDTLWLLQSKLAANAAKATVWYWAFNIFGHSEFNEDTFLTQLKRYLTQEGFSGIADNSLQKDFSCFVRMYVTRSNREAGQSPEDVLDCPLAALELLSQVGTSRTYRFNTGPRATLQPSVFAYVLYRYAEVRHPSSTTIPFDAVQWDVLSPGRVFCLDGEAILSYLEELSERRAGGLLTFARTAGLNQIHLKGVRSEDLLKRIYDR